MKRTILFVAIMAMAVLSAAAQTVTCVGNFTGKGRETLTFSAVGYSDRDYLADEVPDVYKISGMYSPTLYFMGYYLTPAGV